MGTFKFHSTDSLEWHVLNRSSKGYTKYTDQTCELHLHNLVDLLQFCLHTIAKAIKSVKISPGGRSLITGVISPIRYVLSPFQYFTQLTSSTKGQASRGTSGLSPQVNSPHYTDRERPYPTPSPSTISPFTEILDGDF